MRHLQFDDDVLHGILPGAPQLAVSDVEVIGQIAFLTAEIDLDESIEELAMLQALNRSLWRLIGAEPQPIIPISPLPVDDEERARWLRELVPQLTSGDARELAYAAAYLAVVSDLELAPVEIVLLGELQRALGLDGTRAVELAEAAARTLTALDQECDPDEPMAGAGWTEQG